MKTNLSLRSLLATTSVVAALAAMPAFAASVSTSQTSIPYAQAAPADALVQAVQAKLKKPQFQNVQVSAAPNGTITLAGSVSLFEYKQEATRRAQKATGATAILNQIEVATISLGDSELTAALGRKLAYDRVGFGNVFNAITLKVQNGTVTLGGHARTPWDRDSAVAVAASCVGVRDLVDTIEVDPLSSFDDRTRMALLRAIYGYDVLSKYALDPAKPIRISVQNGVVTLYGTVESKMDKQIAYMRARLVPNVFEVRDQLVVASQ